MGGDSPPAWSCCDPTKKRCVALLPTPLHRRRAGKEPSRINIHSHAYASGEGAVCPLPASNPPWDPSPFPLGSRCPRRQLHLVCRQRRPFSAVRSGGATPLLQARFPPLLVAMSAHPRSPFPSMSPPRPLWIQRWEGMLSQDTRPFLSQLQPLLQPNSQSPRVSLIKEPLLPRCLLVSPTRSVNNSGPLTCS